VSLKKLGRYELVRVLGRGAMGIVYEGRDPNLERRVAIKTVKVENLSEEAAAEYESRFRTEARSAARLQHPNIVSVYDSDRDGDMAFLVMEYIQGDDLKHHLDKGVRYSLEQSLKMIRDLLSALEYAHAQNIVHRDVKPANMLIEPAGRVKLTDFGVARIQDSGEATRTQGSMVGTLKYMSPEQVQGQKIDARADLFSVGVVLYQLLTDKRPFDGDNDFSIIHQIIGHTPAPPSTYNGRLPPAIDAVVARALAKDREQRFATARDFSIALQSAIRRAEDPTVVPPADPSRKTDGSVSTVTHELELVYWSDIRDSTDTVELEGFLDKFPEGIYSDLARRRVRKLKGETSPDQTQLSGMPVHAVDEELESVSTAAAPSMVPRDASTATVPTHDVSRATSARHAVLAGIGLLAAAGIAASLMMGKRPPEPVLASPSGAASSTAPDSSRSPTVVLTGASVPMAVVPGSPAVAAATFSAGKASAPRRVSSAPKVIKAPASMPVAEVAKAAGPAPVLLKEEVRVASTPTPVATSSAVEACKDKIFLSREFCLAEHCDKAGVRNHPLCVQRRDEAKLREESKVRN
jgi:serine/threonine protein kinase